MKKRKGRIIGSLILLFILVVLGIFSFGRIFNSDSKLLKKKKKKIEKKNQQLPY